VRKLIVALLLAVLPVVGGCASARHMFHWFHSDPCATRSPFMKAQSVPPLRVPEGLPAANTKNGLKIPDDVGPVTPRTPGGKCLDAPPSFYADRPKPAPPK